MVSSSFGDKPRALILIVLLWLIGGIFYACSESQVFAAYLADPLKTADSSTMAITLILGAETCFAISMIVAAVGVWFKKVWAKKLAIISPIVISALLVTSITIWVNVHLQAGIPIFRLNFWNSYHFISAGFSSPSVMMPNA